MIEFTMVIKGCLRLYNLVHSCTFLHKVLHSCTSLPNVVQGSKQLTKVINSVLFWWAKKVDNEFPLTHKSVVSMIHWSSQTPELLFNLNPIKATGSRSNYNNMIYILRGGSFIETSLYVWCMQNIRYNFYDLLTLCN